MKERILRIAKTISVSGREQELMSVIESEITADVDISYDVMGNLYVKKAGNGGKNILVSVSVDSEGFFINYVKHGEKTRIAPTFPVTDYSTVVGSKLVGHGISGTVCSEKESDIKPADIYFQPDDSEFRVEIGDHLSFVSHIKEEENSFIGRRAAAASLTSALIDAINTSESDNTVTAVFAVCSVPGGRGLKTVWYTAKPDKAIVLRTLESDKDHPLLLAKDGMVLSDTEMFKKASDTLKKENAEHSLSAITDTKRDSLSVNLSGTGIPTLSLAMPAKDIGTNNEKVSASAAEKVSAAIAKLLKISY